MDDDYKTKLLHHLEKSEELNSKDYSNENIIYSILQNIRTSKGAQENKNDDLKCGITSDVFNDKQGTKEPQNVLVMASMVPDEVIYEPNNSKKRMYYAALMFADVTGFTDLCERYTATGKDGTSRLTQVLNSYIGAMVQEIITHKGDLLKFSGDAFLAMWKCTPEMSIHDAVHTAIDCALIIQRDYGAFKTDIGVLLKVKVAISGGSVLFSTIGNENIAHYGVIGQPVWDVKKAEQLSKAGDVVASPSAWKYVNTSQYMTKLSDDKVHLCILGIGSTWKHVDLLDSNIDYVCDYGLDSDVSTSDVDITNQEFYSQNIETIIRTYTDRSVINVRKSVKFALESNLQDSLKRFVLLPVMKAIENNEPMGFLNEMRYVTIVFVNLVSKITEEHILVKIVDKAYNVTCNIVQESNGIVNKVSLFDKDIMFLVVFGLRGLKHEMNVQSALFCAAKLRENIYNIPHIQSVSIGVSSGIVYCGIVGHTMRREYTVIGLCVNKAARLMVAYPDKITCSKEVFIQSKVSENHFTRMPFKDLKGLTNVGPIYGFEYIGNKVIKTTSELIGRDHEMNICKSWLVSLLNNFKAKRKIDCNLLIVEGETTVGKTRIIEDLLGKVPKNVKFSKMYSIFSDKNVNFSAARDIILCGFRSISNSNNESHFIEAEIEKLVEDAMPVTNLCYVNDVLNTNFPKNKEYLTNDDVHKRRKLKEILMIIFEKVFINLHIVVIFNAENIDDASWKLIPFMLNNINFVLILGLNRAHVANNENEILSSLMLGDRARVVSLSGINRWHHTSIICQILSVDAISPELEKIVQVNSEGMPGWINKFIKILMQSDQIIISEMNKEEALSIGAVMPLEDDIIYSKKKKSLTTDSSHIGWAMFHSSFRSNLDKNKSSSSNGNFLLKVALLKPTFKFESLQIEATSYILFLKTYDQLTSFEKLILKCSSSLGEIFSRTLMINVLRLQMDRELAIAISRLFDVELFECASGDFTKGNNLYIRPLADYIGTKGANRQCYCVGINIKDEDKDLPKYAWCGYIRFCDTNFYNYSYDLLTDNQKKDFHNRAIYFLENNIRKCNSCGGGRFNIILGIPGEDIFDPDMELSEEFTDYLRTGGFDFQYFKTPGSCSLQKTKEISLPKKSSKEQDDIFNMIHLTDCECEMFLSIMYTQIIEHCKKSDKMLKLLEAYFEYTQLQINFGYIQEAMVVLREVEQFFTSPKFNLTHNNRGLRIWQNNFIMGRIACRIGNVMFEYGNIHEAKKQLHKAMYLFEHPFPTSQEDVKTKTFVEVLKRKLALDFFPQLSVGVATGLKAALMEQVSQTLGCLFKYHLTLGNHSTAYMCAVWGFNCALYSNSNFALLCNSISNMITIARHADEIELCNKIEQSALKICAKMERYIDVTEFHAYVNLFTTIFLFRIYMAKTQSANQIGYKLMTTLQNIGDSYSLRLILTAMGTALTMKKEFNEALALYKELRVGAHDQDIYSKTSYYAKTLDLFLDSGYMTEPYDVYYSFNTEFGEDIFQGKHPDVAYHFIINLWVRCLRTKEWDYMVQWLEKSKGFLDHFYGCNINLLTGMRYLEGLLLLLVWETDNKNFVGYRKILSDLRELNIKMKKMYKQNIIFHPRIKLLKAYYRFIMHNDNKVKKYLKTGLAMAKELKNYLMIDWFNHTERAWFGEMEIEERNYWVTHAQPGNEIMLTEQTTVMDPVIPYTYPTPTYRF